MTVFLCFLYSFCISPVSMDDWRAALHLKVKKFFGQLDDTTVKVTGLCMERVAHEISSRFEVSVCSNDSIAQRTVGCFLRAGKERR
jgi:hypothetical protein